MDQLLEGADVTWFTDWNSYLEDEKKNKTYWSSCGSWTGPARRHIGSKDSTSTQTAGMLLPHPTSMGPYINRGVY